MLRAGATRLGSRGSAPRQLIGMTDLQSRGAGKAARSRAFLPDALNLPSSRRDQIPGDLGGSVMNNFSLLTADRATHLKVVAVALVCAMLVAGVGLAARVADPSAAADGRLEATVIKPATPVTASVSEPRTIR
jgi:hypothetical protein